MSLLSEHDFDSTSGQKKIITTIHHLECRVHELENEIKKLSQKESQLEHELQGPEAY